MEFFTLLKASQKSGKPNGVFWFSAKTEARAKLQVQVIIEDAGIETGRGHDYQLPIFTDYPVVDDLPEEEVIDFTWCDRYELGEDGRTWQKLIVGEPAAAKPEVKEETETTNTNGQISPKVEEAMLWPVAQMSQRSLILSQFINEEFTHHATMEQRKKIADLEMDMDNSYVQNMLWAADKATGFKSLSTHNVWQYTQAIKTVFAQDKRHELNAMITFAQGWVETPHIDRGLFVKEWAAGKRVTQINRTPSGANAGGGAASDRKFPQTILGLESEIALGLLARRRDFNIYNVPVDIEIQANGIMNKMDNPEWLATRELFVSMPGGLDYSRACIIATVKTTPENLWESPFRHREYLNKVMTESDHANPDQLIIDIACGDSSLPMPMLVKNDDASDAPPVVPEITDTWVDEQLAVDRGEFVPGVSDPTDPKWDHTPGTTNQLEEAADHVQMEATIPVESEVSGAVPASQGADDTCAPAATLTNSQILAAAAPELVKAFSESAEPEVAEEQTPEYPAYFDLGRYEGLPNSVYHAANGISSTMVKDARVSLMYYHARHVAKTIARESTEALTFGSLVHALALEPEKFDEEFAVFPGVPAGAFTNTDTLKAWMREYNADKSKAEQLKLTGKKEELQEAIRAVNPNAIFADEYEDQWRDSVAGKTIISIELLASAKAIQQALFSNSDASDILNNPGRKSEVSYFGIDEETGLSIRVRPDIEIRTSRDRICADLKTVSIGNVRQDRIKERLHREIIDRDYHLSAAMYCDIAGLDSFSWIFVNKEAGYHWVAVVQASEMELELGRQEYRRALRQINNAMEFDEWPAPIIGTYTDELNDYDLRRLESLVESLAAE